MPQGEVGTRSRAARPNSKLGTGSAEDRQLSSGIDRALQVIFAVATSSEPDVGVSELARSLGLSKAVVHRVVRTLVAADFFSFDPRTRRYRLGPGAVTVGLAAMARIEVPKIAQPYLEHLVERTRETATLSVRYGDKRMYLTQVLSPQEIRMSVQLGIMYPLHAGASSKAILAAMDSAECRRYVESASLEPLTPNTVFDTQQLLADLELARRRGFAVSLGERQADAWSVAAPVIEATGRIYGSISVCGPVTRISQNKAEELGELVRDAAAMISKELGYQATSV